MSNIDLLNLLLLVLGVLLTPNMALLPNLFDPQKSRRRRLLIFGLLAIFAFLVAVGSTLLTTPKAEQNADWIQKVYWTLGLGYALALPTMLYLLITKEKAETPSPRNLLLKAVQEEITQRLETSLHNQKMIELATKELPHHVGGMPISEKPQPINWVELRKNWVSKFLRMPNLGI